MAEPILLIDIATTDAASEPAPAPRAAASWVPAAYLAGGTPAPTGFAAAPRVDAAALSWTPASGTLVTVIERAPDVAGVAGTYSEIQRSTAREQLLTATPGTTYWYRVATVRNGVYSAYATALSVAAYHADRVLAPSDKPPFITLRQQIAAEQPSLEARADALSITTEKTAYTAAIAALDAYLATLTTPTPWSDTTGYTTL